MKKFIFLMDDMRLTFHWHYIGKLRNKAITMVDKGIDCFHPDLVKYSDKILYHGIIISKIWQRQKKYSPHQIDIDLDSDELPDRRVTSA